MLDQSFSAKHFRRIVDLENRRGNYLEGRYFPGVKRVTDRIQRCASRKRELAKRHGWSSDSIKPVKRARKRYEKIKEDRLWAELEEISNAINASSFKLSLTQAGTVKGKPVFSSTDDAASFFALKQLQRNFFKVYGVKQSDRDTIINQLKGVLDNSFPKFVLRTDISQFYESIPQQTIINKVDTDGLLIPLSRKILRQVLSQYTELSSSGGIPRGVGVSAYLAELFMRDIDVKLSSLGSVNYRVCYYARFVDDIVMVLVPRLPSTTSDYRDQVRNELLSEIDACLGGGGNGLQRNIEKTQFGSLLTKADSYEFSYLGYKFELLSGVVHIGLSEKRIEKYRKRIDAAIAAYKNRRNNSEKYCRALLAKRIRFLTNNTRLKNAKNNILVGSYFSNKCLSHTKDFAQLDLYLDTAIKQNISKLEAQRRIKKYSFVEGHAERRFSPFSISDLREIQYIWE